MAKMLNSNTAVKYINFIEKASSKQSGEIITETPVSLTVNGEEWFTFMCTPIELEALVVGFLFNEGLIESAAEIESVRVCPAMDNVDVWLTHNVERPSKWRHTSGCTGGVTSVVSLLNHPLPISEMVNGTALSPSQVTRMVELLLESQDLYKKSGGVHTSVLSDDLTILARGEDIGRHNTLDKIAGHCLLKHLAFTRRILLTTGRISSEMIQKAARLGASIVISRTSPSSLSIDLANQWGITLIGYAKRNRFRVYSHPERIIIDENQ